MECQIIGVGCGDNMGEASFPTLRGALPMPGRRENSVPLRCTTGGAPPPPHPYTQVPGRALGAVIRAGGGLPLSRYFRPSMPSPLPSIHWFAGRPSTKCCAPSNLLCVYPSATTLPRAPPCCAHSAALNEVLRSVKVGFADYWCNVLQVCVGGSLDLHVDLPVDIGAEWQADSFLLKPLALPHTLNLRTCLLTPHTPALSLRPPPQVWPLDREWFLAPYLALDGSCNNTSNVVGRKR